MQALLVKMSHHMSRAGRIDMKRMLFSGLLGFVIIFVAVFSTMARSGAAVASLAAPPTPTLVKVPMADGLEIWGDFYAATGTEKAPAALLLHQFNGSSFEWQEFAVPLAEQGYNVLAIDMRGQGLTGGDVDWKLAESDALALMGWLREQETVDPDRVSVIGASVGANLALRVCAQDEACHAVIALSPGLGYFGVATKDTVSDMKHKALFLVASQNDTPSGNDIKDLAAAAPSSADVLMHIYASSNRHGTAMFSFPDLIPMMLTWLDSYNVS
jgi:alpha-beta hydrolase superfamily lysophospholipase